MSPKSIYLDTSVVSALFDERTPERLQLTKTAWENFNEYDVYISQIVIDELSAARGELKKKFLSTVKDFIVLSVNDEVENLAKKYIEQNVFPRKYYDDALHVAVSSVNNVEFLLSWNFKHLVKVKTRRLVALINTINDYSPVEIIAPPEL